MEQKEERAEVVLREEGEGIPPEPVVITRPTWVTWSAVLICVGVFVGLNLEKDKHSWAVLSSFGFLPAEQIWSGGWWGAMTATLVHIAPMHAFFNLYWIWQLGRLMENEIGSLRFLAFYLGAAVIGSTAQLAVSDTTGIGASGVVYAIFGFMWRTRLVYPSFQRIMHRNTIQIFFIWLVACFFLTSSGLMNIANAAHVAGLIFGAVVAECFVVRQRRMPFMVAAVVLAGVALIPLWWAPWSITWQGVRASEDMTAGRVDKALERLDYMIKRDPENAWAHHNRGALYLQRGETEKAEVDLKKAKELKDGAVEQE
jgi:GlpG protein